MQLLQAADWGSVADWVAGLGTLGAIGWAVFLYRRQVDVARRTQASKVTASLIRDNYELHDAGMHEDYEAPLVLVQNRSDLPVYDVAVLLVPRGNLPGKEELAELLVAGARRPTEVIKASDFRGISFRDESGHLWQKDRLGRLSEVSRHGRCRRWLNKRAKKPRKK